LIFVVSTEGGRVIYNIFDTAVQPPVEYRDAVAEKAFKKQFSWPGSKDKWTWHDKTPFPWDRIMDLGGKAGAGFASADALNTAAQRVAQSRHLRGSEVDPDDYAHMTPKEIAGSIVKKLQDAIKNLDV
jgi:hypothetical protein